MWQTCLNEWWKTIRYEMETSDDEWVYVNSRTQVTTLSDNIADDKKYEMEASDNEWMRRRE